jgi:hypothetical protein
MHQGAVNSALKKTPPLRRAILKTSDDASIDCRLIWSFRHVLWRQDHSRRGLSQDANVSGQRRQFVQTPSLGLTKAGNYRVRSRAQAWLTGPWFTAAKA